MDIFTLGVKPRRPFGYTLIEMLTTLALAGVLLTTGIPEFNRILASNRMISEINHLVAHLHLARSEAVKRGKRIVLCPSSDADQCMGAPEWHLGYILFVDDNGNRERDPREALIRTHAGDAPGILITSSVNRRRISYRPDGASPGSNLSLKFCEAQNATPPKAVILSNTGRPRVSRTGTDGQPLVCS